MLCKNKAYVKIKCPTILSQDKIGFAKLKKSYFRHYFILLWLAMERLPYSAPAILSA